MPEPRDTSRYWLVATCPNCSATIHVFPARQDGQVPTIRSETPGAAKFLVSCTSCHREASVTPEELRHQDLDSV